MKQAKGENAESWRHSGIILTSYEKVENLRWCRAIALNKDDAV